MSFATGFADGAGGTLTFSGFARKKKILVFYADNEVPHASPDYEESFGDKLGEEPGLTMSHRN
ncbi:MAG: hypothetical protein LBD30_00635 [Verrucomicrobiales bacterium]|nr:hypothetical protein [Verrucomicrobiales bacterium]